MREFILNTDEALVIFNFNSLDELSKSNITKRYRELAKKYHPDLASFNENTSSYKMAQLNVAFKTLNNYIRSIEALHNREVDIIIVKLHDFINIVHGGHIVVNGVTINKKFMYDNRLYIQIPITVFDGETVTEYKVNETIKALNKYQAYIIYKTNKKEFDLKVTIEDKEIKLHLNNTQRNVVLNFNFDNLIKIELRIDIKTGEA